MAGAFDSRSFSLGSLLSRNEKKRVSVPPFQRGYSWEDTHVETFVNDVINVWHNSKRSNEGYFLGPIVVMLTTNMRLLDGQQRLATATIFLAALRDYATATNTEDGRILARDIQREFIRKTEDQYAMDLGENDRAFFRNMVQRDPRRTVPPKHRSHQLIINARKRIEQMILPLLDGNPTQQKLGTCEKLRDVITQELMVVRITVRNEEDAFQIFETLNDRGLRLSVPDLVLNHLMSKVSSSEKRKLVREEWSAMLDLMGKRDISKFLRHMWVSQHGDIKNQPLFRAIREDLKDSPDDALSFAEACAEECESYVALLDLDESKLLGHLALVKPLIKNLEVTACQPLLLSAFRCLSTAQFGRIVKSLTNLIVRYAVISNLSLNQLEDVLYDQAREIRRKKTEGINERDIVEEAIAAFREIDPPDDRVESAASEATLSRSRATYIVTELANQDLGDGQVIVGDGTLEHIFPQNAKDIDWPNRTLLDPYIWSIGNLTLLKEKHNSRASNKSYAVKCTNYYSGSLIPMTNSIPTAYPSWGVVEILDRSLQLASGIVTRWPAL